MASTELIQSQLAPVCSAILLCRQLLRSSSLVVCPIRSDNNFGAAWVAGLDPFGVYWLLWWLLWGQVLFVISGLLWALILIPAQIRQARLASSFEATGVIPIEYWRDAQRWTWWGILAIVPLLGAIWIMIAKPAEAPAEPTDRLNRGKQEQVPRAWTVSTNAPSPIPYSLPSAIQ